MLLMIDNYDSFTFNLVQYFGVCAAGVCSVRKRGRPTGAPTEIPHNESVILAESSYVYNSATKKALPNAMTFTQKYYLKPRKTAQVTWSST